MSGSNKGYTAAKLGETLQISEDPGYWWIPYIEDRGALRSLLALAEAWDREEIRSRIEQQDPGAEIPESFEETRVFRQTFEQQSGLSVERAIRQADTHRQSSMIGLPDSSDASGTRELLELADRIERGFIGYVMGGMGSGKTDFSILLGELLSRIRSDLEIWSNIRSLDPPESVDKRTVERYERLEQMIEEESDRSRLMIWDEASSNASGYSSDAHEVMDNLRFTLQSFRKNSVNLLIIGHTGKDVHPHIRRQAGYYLEKASREDQGHLKVWRALDDHGDGQDLEMEIEGIPPTSWEFDTDEMSRWFWES